MPARTLVLLVISVTLLVACGDSGNEADQVGVGAACSADGDCPVVECADDAMPCPALVCLTQFTGGYCGLTGCAADVDCPFGSACVAHTDGQRYCFRLCVDKPECNLRRPLEAESNCVRSVDFVEEQPNKACVPPSSGT